MNSKIKYKCLPFVLGMPHIHPMIIAIWCGSSSKPNDLNGYLRKFVTELKELLDSGVSVNGHHIKVLFHCCMCDTLARVFIKGLFVLHFCMYLYEIQKLKCFI